MRAAFRREPGGGSEQIAEDGKSVRHSVDRKRGRWPLHLVSAYATGRDMVLAQRAVDDKGGEAAVLPTLLDGLHLDGCLVSLDALSCRRGVARHIVSRGADYLLALKANRQKAYAAVQNWFRAQAFERSASLRTCFDAFDESHGRLVRRRAFVSPAVGELAPLHERPDLRTLLAVETIRGVTGTGKVEAEIRYFLTSCGDDPAVLVQAIRRHWSIENALHWVLDVTFREDDSRVRDRTAARNLALLRRIALNLVAGDRSGQTSLRGRRKKAAWNDDYMLRIIASQAHA